MSGKASAQRLMAGADAEDDGQQAMSTLAGCNLPLPGGGDLEGGLAGMYFNDRQGSAFLLAPSITARQTYTDNVTLAADDAAESEWVTQVSPAISFCRNANRFRVQLDYEAQNLNYWNDASRNDTYHRANADVTTTLLRDRLFLDLGATHDQQAVTLGGPLVDDNALITGSRANTIEYRISPYLFQDLGPVGTAMARYAYTRTNYDKQLENAYRQSGNLVVTSPPQADPVSWQASASSERVEQYQEARYFDDAFLELGYLLTGRLRLTGRAGLETELGPSHRQNRFDESYWGGGFRWTGDRTLIEARYGNRFYGDTYFAAISRRSSQLTMNLDYTETQQISDRFSVLTPGDVGLPDSVTDPDTGDTVFLPSVVLAENEIFLSKRGSASVSFVTGRSNIRLGAFNEEREYVATGETEDRMGGAFSWRWQWLPRTAVIPRVMWEHIELRDGREDTLRGAQISLAHLLSPDMQAGASVRRQQRVSSDAGADYTEHAVIIQVTRLF
ncbi:MAG: TIGR03016 family PEP-CTERM system-associated outer membrane protein [Aquisalimonadaceae bacterium]